MRRLKAFTLVELLLVVSLITILISLLLPALGRVKTAAKLSLCQANLKSIGEGALGYAAHNASRYPQRPGSGKPTVIKGAGTDFRPMFREFISPSLLSCPLSPAALDFDEDPTPATAIEVNYGLWFGWRYDAGGRGLLRLNSKIEYGGNQFNVLAGDWESAQVSGKIAETSHNDHGNTMPAWVADNENFGGTVYKFARWNQWAGTGRGLMDKNFLFGDGSVTLFTDLTLDHASDDRFWEVPVFKGLNQWTTFLPLSQ